MAATAADYAGWVRELDSYEAQNDDDDARYERDETMTTRILSSRGSIASGRKSKPPRSSHAEELQQEMKLLNWHKLANEAALKAAIIKTNKIKQEDASFAHSLTHEDMDEKQQRIQQIIEEEQLKPLQVNSEFFRDFAAREKKDEIKMDDDVQRHIDHLKKLKSTMSQREDVQKRRQRYHDGIQQLNGRQQSNQEDDDNPPRKDQRSKYSHMQRAVQSGSKHADVICSLDKLMELEKRIRNLEDAGLGMDTMSDDRRMDYDDDNDSNSLLRGSKSGNIRFAKRQMTGGLHEPSKTVHVVKTKATQANSKANKMRAKDPLHRMQTSTAASAAKKRTLTSNITRMKPGGRTFLTSLPDNKQAQLRRMTERERRVYLKNEKAAEAKQRNMKQEVVIDGWLDRKRQAASQRRVAAANHSSTSRAGAQNAAGSRTNASTTQRRPVAVAPPKVRAPMLGAASGKRIGNAHLQKFDDIKKGFEKRKEILNRAPTNVKPAPIQSSSHHSKSNRKWGNTLPPAGNARIPAFSAAVRSGLHPNHSGAASQVSTRGYGGSTKNSGIAPSAPNGNNNSSKNRNPTGTTILPAISINGAGRGGGTRGLNPSGISAAPAPQTRPTPIPVSRNSTGTLPRLAPAARAVPLPSPPPIDQKFANGPQFSRLHKR